ncbi:DoxX family protein [Yersinia aldovae]|uniref:DoxX family protein n=1 Tax=Yersinia aldovae TaxID=29483 RepID=UPI0011A47208|nr:DoxX family protein [Yersinia aldovae]
MLANLNIGFTRLTHHPDSGKLLLRLTFGILMLFHGVAKIQHGTRWIAESLQSQGMPGFVAYGVYIGEIVTPILIILGLFTRPVAFTYAINLLVAVLMVGTAKFFTLTQVGAWSLENEALYILSGLAIMLLGSGRYSITKNEAYR